MKISQLKSYFPRILIVVSLLSATPALALEVDAPLYADGNYTVSFSGCLNLPTTVYCRLEERVGTQGTWINVPSSNGSAAFTNKPEGEYFYRAHEYTFDEIIVGGEPIPIFEHFYSDEARLIVHDGPIPVPGTIEEQLQYTYKTRVGDLNGDSLQDILVKRTSGGETLDGSIDAVILQAVAGGIFTEIVPSAAQLLEAESWQEVAIAIILDDLNADGFLDVFLKDLASTITGALDQMIYAPGEIFSSDPKGIRAVDTGLVDFVEDSFAWYVDDDYFEDNAVVVDQGYWHPTVECVWHYNFWEERWEYECEVVFEWVEVLVTEYPGLDPDAINVYETSVDYRNGQEAFEAVVQIFETVFGAEIGGQTYCDDLELHIAEIPNEDECEVTSVSEALAAVRRTIEQLQAPANVIFGREVDVVYITYHAWIGFADLVKHTALEYRSPLSGAATTLSAEEIDGKLVSSPNRITDLAIKNTVVASVYHYLPAGEYFQTLETAEGYYKQCLPYFLTPELTSSADYNSNSLWRG